VLASQLKVGQEKLRSAADDLNGVTPPKDVEKDNQALAKGLQTLADELESLRSAAAKKDPALVQKALNDLKSSHALVDARAATDDMRKKGYKLGGLQLARLRQQPRRRCLEATPPRFRRPGGQGARTSRW
jgi:hypothetical protein